MTLSTIPRYRRAAVSPLGDHAVVIGASVAGLLAARVLSDAYATVTVVDRDDLPDGPDPRPGVPQGSHPHALLEAGRATVEDLLPGCTEDVVSAGGVITDFAGDVQFFQEGGVLAAGPTRRETISVSRPRFEYVVRRHVSKLENVRFRTNCYGIDYRTDDAGTAVEGVEIRDGGRRRVLPAELVVDATGRTSRTPAWLEAHGYEAPPVDEVRIDVAYSTTYIERPPDDRRTYLVPPSPPRTRGGMVAPVEDGRWVANLHGVHGDDPPTDREGFVDFAATLPVPEIARVVDTHPWAADGIVHYPFPTNRRHRYEELERFPDGLVVIGDAIASFNPVYAQGMSVASLEALLLHHTVADGADGIGLRFFHRTEPLVDIAWSLAVGADFGFPETRGPKPRGTAFFDWYTSRLLRRAHTDGTLSDAFVRVLMMESPPSLLMHPRVLWRVLAPGRSRDPARPRDEPLQEGRETDGSAPPASSAR